MSGDHKKHSVPPADEALLEYWEKVFIQKYKGDCRPLERAIDTFEEIDVRSRRMKSFRLWRFWRILLLEDIATHMTFWLFIGCPPDALKKGIVTCIPKKQGTLNPGDFRPITVGPIIGRFFHRMLSRRMLTYWCKLAQRVAFLRTTVKATVVTCRVRNPACTSTKRPWESALYKWSKRPWRSRLWRYINKLTYLLTYLLKPIECRQWWHTSSPMKMSFCSML